MTPEQHVEQAVLQYPALEEVLQVPDATVRAAALHAITLAVQEAQHAERRECARIAVESLQTCSEPVCQAVAEEIATEILARGPPKCDNLSHPEPSYTVTAGCWRPRCRAEGLLGIWHQQVGGDKKWLTWTNRKFKLF